MALTFQELINTGVLDALATVYREPTDAQLLLTSIGFPVYLLPNFDRQGDPLAFWARVCQLIQNGAFAGGFEALVEAASTRYPANPPFARFAEGQPRQATVSQTIPADYLISHLFIEGPDLSRWEVNDLQASLRLEAVVADFVQAHPELATAATGSVQLVSVSRIQADGSAEPLDQTKTLKDKPAVRKLYHRLIEDGFQPWHDVFFIKPGQDWEREIEKAVRATDIMLVCLTQDVTTRAGYIHKEIKFALDVADRQLEDTIFIIPVKLEECTVPDRLRRWHWIQLTADDEKPYKKLVGALKKRAVDLALGADD